MRLFFAAIGKYAWGTGEQIQRSKSRRHIRQNSPCRFIFAHFSCDDDDQKTGLDSLFPLDLAIGLAHDALTAVSLECLSVLFGYRKADAVEGFLEGVFLSQSLCLIIGENIDDNGSFHRFSALLVGFDIEVVFLDGVFFHFFVW